MEPTASLKSLSLAVPFANSLPALPLPHQVQLFCELSFARRGLYRCDCCLFDLTEGVIHNPCVAPWPTTHPVTKSLLGFRNAVFSEYAWLALKTSFRGLVNQWEKRIKNQPRVSNTGSGNLIRVIQVRHFFLRSPVKLRGCFALTPASFTHLQLSDSRQRLWIFGQFSRSFRSFASSTACISFGIQVL